MTPTSKNRLIHIAGVIVSIAVVFSAVSLTPSFKDIVVCVIGVIAVLGNVVGVARPTTWFH